MRIASTPVTTLPASPRAARPEPAPDPNCTAPEDGQSHYNPEAARWIRPLNNLLVAATLRKEVHGAENLPSEGGHLLCLNHQSYLDASVATSLSGRDWRFMAAKEQFVGRLGEAMADMGAFPVDRTNISTQPVEVAIDLLNNGTGVGIFPEGRMWSDGKVHDLKNGAAKMALRSTAETMVPAAISYQPHQTTVGEKAAAYAAATAVVGAGIAASMTTNPWVRGALGLVTGAVAGGAIGGAVSFARSKTSDIKDRALESLGGVKAGAALGALAGGLGEAFLPHQALYIAAPLSGVAGLVTLAGGKHFAERQHAKVAVGQGIEIAPYRLLPTKEGEAKLTADLQTALVSLKAGLEGA